MTGAIPVRVGSDWRNTGAGWKWVAVQIANRYGTNWQDEERNLHVIKRQRTVKDWTADRILIALGHHPSEIYGLWWEPESGCDLPEVSA